MHHGQWIWHDAPAPLNAYADFIAPFAYDGAAPLTLEISADSQYEAYLNGHLVAFGQYPDYPWHKVYDAVDIAAHARPGDNRLCIRAYWDGAPSSVYHPGQAALRFAVTAAGHPLCESGRHVMSRISPDYVSGPVEKVTPQLSFSFACDTRDRDGWLADGAYDPAAAAFRPSREIAASPPMHPRPVAMLAERPPEPARVVAYGTYRLADDAPSSPSVRMQTAWLSPSGVVATPLAGEQQPYRLDGTHPVAFASAADPIYLLVDLASEQAGFLELDIELPHDAALDVGYGEHLDDLRVRTSVGGRCYAARITVGPGRTRFTHRMKRIAGRYLQVLVPATACTLHHLSIRPVAYPLPDGGAFACSDHLHERIYRTAVHTLRTCMHTHFEDCPMREQALYGMDARNQMLCAYYAFGETRMARASLRLLALDQRPDGLLPICAPSDMDITIPGFSLFWIIALQEYVQFSGDRALGIDMLPVAERLLEAFAARRDARGLAGRFTEPPYWNFYEWQPGLDGDAIRRDGDLPARIEAPLNALWALALRRMAALCEALGVASDIYRARYDDIAAAFHDAFWDDARGMYRTFASDAAAHISAYANALALCADLCPQSERSALLERIAHPAPDVVPATLSCAFFTYEALLTEPRWQSFVFDDIARTYGDMLFAGATTFWETQRGAWDFGNAASLCHGWSAIPIYFYHAYVLGLRPDAGGGFHVQPAATGIAWARGGAARMGQRTAVRVEATRQGAAAEWETTPWPTDDGSE